MTTTAKHFTGKGAVAVTLIWLASILFGCAAQVGQQGAGQETASSTGAKQIIGIAVESDESMDRIRIRGSQPLTFTSVPKPSPTGVELYFPQTVIALADANTNLTVPETAQVVTEVRPGTVSADTATASIEILTRADAPYEAVREGNDVVVSFRRAAQPPEAPAALQSEEIETAASPVPVPEVEGTPATRIETINVQRLENGVEIRVRADGPIKDYASFTLRNPDRIVYDLYKIDSPYTGEQVIATNAPWVSRVRHYGDSEKLRVVLDTSAENFQATTAMPIQEGLLIHVGQVARADAPMPTPPAAGPAGPAWVNRIDFSAEPSGKSVVIVGTTAPVQYRMEKIDDRRLQLRLDSAQIPGFRRRPLLTTRFNSAVDRIIPVQSDRLKNTGLITIELRQAVPYAVEQVDNLLMVHFDPSTVPPKAEDKAKLPEWQQVVAEAVTATSATSASVKTGADESAAEPAGVSSLWEKKEYTGEKIALDFYETDIKNVFRILREVSGKNFAIDQDVRGTVTLTLDKPVPWDQVMDLILKMNQLGQIMEGDVVRIATLSTLQAEEKMRQDSLAAEQKTKEAVEAQEPLVTEYIAVNYSNAKTDILPHLEKLVTGDSKDTRGSVTVHEATNQIIIKATAAMIKEARSLTKELDKVTPQVLIEARIVEANKNFERQIGTKFGIGPGTGSFNSDTLGGDWDLSLSSNFPNKNSGSGISFDFSRLVGSPLAINAAIDASETAGDSKTISSPKVLTLDNKEAMIKQGVSYPINKLDADGNSTTEFKDIVLELKVTPHVTLDNRVSMKISITKNDVGPLVGQDYSFTVNEATTELLVNDADTVVIGGISKTTETSGETGLPGLRKIPILGWLFGMSNMSNKKEELMIFITPRIVNLEKGAS